MHRILCFALLVGACAAPAKPASGPASAPTTPVLASAAQRFVVPGYGLSAEFPRPPELSNEVDELVATQLLLEGDPSFMLSTHSARGKDRPPDDKWFEAVRAGLKLEKGRDVGLESLRGVELAGVRDGKRVRVRLFAWGDSLLVAEVAGKNGKLDDALATRFLDSVQLAPHWRLYASPTTKFSVMVPDHAIEIDQTEKGAERPTQFRGFFVGGDDALTYWAGAWELAEREAGVSDDAMLDVGIQHMRDNGNDVTWQGPVTLDGARGRDFLSSSKGEQMMGRLVLTERFVYLLMVSAKSRAALSRADSAKFYASLVWY